MIKLARFRLDTLKRALYALEDRYFDLLNNFDTSGIVNNQGLSTSSEWKDHATAYHAVWTRNIRTLIAKCIASGEHPSAFIDIGCGKGKACFYAARTRKFDSIVGVDFDASLIDAARANLARFRRPGIEFRVADAAAVDLGRQQSLVFMFNPFDAVVLELFVSRNIDSFRQHGHILAYANDLHRRTLIDSGFSAVFRDPLRKISLWRVD